MSGTSVDAVDAALILTDGEKVHEFGPVSERKYTEAERDVLHGAVSAARKWNWEGEPPVEAFRLANGVLTQAHAEAFRAVLEQCGDQCRPELVGVHGQTVLHRPPAVGRKGNTLQILDAARLAEQIGLPLAYDFRSADVQTGGQGAPLAPVYHKALIAGLEQPVAVLNLGGVANITYIEEDEILGFDCGPANGPIDEWVLGHRSGTHDTGGKFAAAGVVHEGLLSEWLDHPFFSEPMPKSLDRYDFNANLARGLSLEDGCATLTAFSAAGVALGLELFPKRAGRLIVCGGGRHNPVLMQELRDRCDMNVLSAEDQGWRGDSIEAEAFAVLAVRTKRGMPISFPGTTGVSKPMTGGQIIYPAA